MDVNSLIHFWTRAPTDVINTFDMNWNVAENCYIMFHKILEIYTADDLQVWFNGKELNSYNTEIMGLEFFRRLVCDRNKFIVVVKESFFNHVCVLDYHGIIAEISMADGIHKNEC